MDQHSLLEAAQGSKLKADQIDELAQLADLTILPCPKVAFIRIETVADFEDALVLALSGVRVSYEPIAGSLGGFAQAMNIITTRRVADVNTPFKPPKKFWLIDIPDAEPATIAGAVGKMLAHKNRLTDIQIDLTRLPPGPMAEALAHALTGAANLLNWRAGRTLSVSDIADLFEWFTGLGCEMDGQIAYGTREWGPFVSRGATDHLPQRANPVISPFSNRTVMCFVRPELSDLTSLFEWSKKTGRGFGLVNGKTYNPTGTWAVGMDTGKSLRLGNHTMMSGLYADFSGADLERAREIARLVARAAYRETLRPVDAALSASWTQQKDFHRLSAIGFGCLDPAIDVDDLMNHADKAAYVQADTLKLTRCDRVQMTGGRLKAFDDPAAQARELHAGWDDFIAANFQP